MTLRQIYEFIIQEGIKSDPRDKPLIDHGLKTSKEHFQKLPADEKEFFDQECLKNPYADTRILNGDINLDVKTVMVGIDIDTSELLLVEWLKKTKKEKIDLVMSHHPQGMAYAHFYEVMDMQADIFNSLGVPINISEKLVEERKNEVSRKVHAANHFRTTDAARLLDIPLMCVHTPADNHATSFLQNLMDQKKPQTLKEILSLLNNIDEYRMARQCGVQPMVLLGKPTARAGKIFVDMTGGTEGPKDMVDHLQTAGVGTLISMHTSEDHYKKFKDKNMNIMVAGHMASDALGMNLLLDKLERTAKIRILTCSGFKRIKR